jgi:hypothetical protein
MITGYALPKNTVLPEAIGTSGFDCESCSASKTTPPAPDSLPTRHALHFCQVSNLAGDLDFSVCTHDGARTCVIAINFALSNASKDSFTRALRRQGLPARFQHSRGVLWLSGQP